MKVAVIGGGFYGIMAALEASKHKDVKEIYIFEKNKSLMQAAGKFNQARLHLGFHYPRSAETICQSKAGFNLYEKRFPRVTRAIEKNIYLIREDGLVSISEYLNIMRKNKISFEDIHISESGFKYISRGVNFKAIKVEEKYIDIVKLNKNLFREINEMGIKVCLNMEAKDIDVGLGEIQFSNGSKGKYDLIINCSYTTPFMGFTKNEIQLKYEYCTLLLISSEEVKNQAVTIMDGQFVSIYPWLSDLHSVSSVKYTPSIRTDTFLELKTILSNRKIIDFEKTNLLIEEHMRSFFDFSYTLVGSFSAIKVKQKKDYGDQRLVKTFSEGKCISVLQGKLDAVNIFLDDLSKRITELR